MVRALTSYGSDHRRLRNLISSAFTPRRTEALRPLVQSLVDRLVAELREVPRGEGVDPRARFAYVIPTEVICDLFGVPAGMRPWMRRVIDAALDTAATPEQAAEDYGDLFGCIAAERAEPGEDTTSALMGGCTG